MEKMDKNNKKVYLLVEASVLPDVFIKVLRAKELLAGGQAKNVSKASAMAGVSRSAFYKYKDCVFYSDNERQTLTITARLLDQTGALQSLLAGISQAGAGVVTINQSIPENGAATVAVTVRTEGMHQSLEELVERLKKQKTVVSVHHNQ